MLYNQLWWRISLFLIRVLLMALIRKHVSRVDGRFAVGNVSLLGIDSMSALKWPVHSKSPGQHYVECTFRQHFHLFRFCTTKINLSFSSRHTNKHTFCYAAAYF
ncbi:hypothetical protein VCUG_00729 [Vavraia culicis subsp. floridensis]|uniref:Uncharacterized protein n=1 Tax=Vavraia culicis (isolate floridensis) TaxID=948595 RepID=L2GWV2_VAVCU|nr:uncharacterized protein VCUG_00729 [Vavraia culicis subsp. floridensis]ELA47768.1 hypothetical protein VCUG_00729 [Vavraia culicis subsp. floridensis]